MKFTQKQLNALKSDDLIKVFERTLFDVAKSIDDEEYKSNIKYAELIRNTLSDRFKFLENINHTR